MIDKHLLMEKLQIATANTISPIVAHGLIKAQEIVLNMEDEDPAVEPTKCIAQLKIDTDELIERIEGSHIIEPKWIPCSERLPDGDKCVLVTNRGSDIEFGEYDNDKDEWRIWEDRHWDAWRAAVTAWMPLPEPYSGEANEMVEGSER